MVSFVIACIVVLSSVSDPLQYEMSLNSSVVLTLILTQINKNLFNSCFNLANGDLKEPCSINGINETKMSFFTKQYSNP